MNRVDLKRFSLDALNALLDAVLLSGDRGLYTVREITDEVMRRETQRLHAEVGSVHSLGGGQ